MDRSFRSGLILLAGIALLAAALVAARDPPRDRRVDAGPRGARGRCCRPWASCVLRAELGGPAAAAPRRDRALHAGRRRRAGRARLPLGALSGPLRHDRATALTRCPSPPSPCSSGWTSPVHIVFFHDPMMRETVELYQLMAAQTPRRHGRVLRSDAQSRPGADARRELRRHRGHGERGPQAPGQRRQRDRHRQRHPARFAGRDPARVLPRRPRRAGSRSAWSPTTTSRARPATPTASGAKYVLHERHGMAKARHALETLNYKVEKVLLLQRDERARRLRGAGGGGPEGAAAARPRSTRSSAYLAGGGNALSCSIRSSRTGLEPVIREYGIVVDDDIVIDEASHFWADVSSPAVTDYNRHQVTRDLPLTFFPGARSLSPTPQRVPGTSVVPLVNSSKNSWGQTNPRPGRLRQGPATRPGPQHADGASPLRRPVAAGRRRRAPEGPRSRIAVVRRLGLRHQLLLSHHGQRHTVPEHRELPGRPGEPHRHGAAHRRPSAGQPHQPADEGHLLPVGDPRPRRCWRWWAPRCGGDSGEPGPAAAGLVGGLAAAGGARGGDRGDRVRGPAPRDVGKRRPPTRACCCRCRWTSSGAIEIADARAAAPLRARRRPAPGSTTARTARPRAPTPTTPDPARAERIAHALRRASAGRASSATSRSDATAATSTASPRPRWSSWSTAADSRSRWRSTRSATSPRTP